MDQILLNKLKSLKSTLKTDFGINEIAVFGSYTKDLNRIESDLDILIMNMDEKNAFTLLKAKNFLSEKLNLKVDLGLFDSLRPIIRNQVKAEMLHV